jgi:cytochrome c-type biogenesis protein CcmH/NrfG
MGSWLSRLGPSLALVLVTALTYAGSFDGDFVSDDIRSIRDNPILRSLDGDHLERIFTGFDGANYMPLKVFSLALDYQLWGPEPWGFHLTNLLLHILTALLVHRILLRLELGAFTALSVALLWAVHPLQVESVAWISERKNVLSGLFFFAAFYVYLSFSEHGRGTAYLGMLGLYLLALLSKMNTLVLPAVCLAYEVSFRFRLRRRDVLASLPLFLLGAAVAAYNLAGSRVHGGPYHGGSAIVTWLSSSVVVLRYLKNTLLPTDLNFYYDVPLRGSLLDPPVLLSVLSLAGIAVATLWCIRRRQRVAFWVLWFGITLAPMLNLIPFRALMQDRYMYLALLGPVVCLGMGLSWAARTWLPRYVAAGLAAAAILGAGALSFQRVEVFDNPVSLWEDWALRVSYVPADPPHRQRDYEAKVGLLRAAIVRDPASAVAHGNLGALYHEVGNSAYAIARLQRAREFAPENRRVLASLGRAYAQAGRLEEAERALSRAGELDPHAFVTQRALARVLLERGDLEGARRALAVCARIRPPGSPAAGSWTREQERLEELEAARGESAP